jgi:hypothetical protein
MNLEFKLTLDPQRAGRSISESAGRGRWEIF